MQAMKRIGNVASNQIYNPRHIKPSMPIDVDEIDMAMERFIRQKYQSKALSGGEGTFATRNNTGSTSSDDKPPPLPPKPGKRFGFGLRSTSSTFPQSRSAGSSSPVQTQPNRERLQSPPFRKSKASRVFGSNVASVQSLSTEDFAKKLLLLQDMGFVDGERNLILLESMDGDVDRCVETLLRLGEGGGSASSKETGPAPPPKPEAANGITIEKTRREVPAKNEVSLDIIQEATKHGSAPATHPQPASTVQTAQISTNPFDRTLRPPANFQQLEQSFQSLQVFQQPQAQQNHVQPLFPNATGGNSMSTQHQPHGQGTPLQMQAHYGSVPNISALQTQQPIHDHTYHYRNTGGNPFLRTSHSQIFSSSNPFNTSMSSSWNNQSASSFEQQQLSPSASQVNDPFNSLSPSSFQQQQQQQIQQTQRFMQDPQQAKQQVLESQSMQQGSAQPFNRSPLFQASSSLQQQQQNPMAQGQQNSQPSPKIPVVYDKSSILALYNYPHLAPNSIERATSVDTTATATATALHPPNVSVPKLRSATMPLLSVSSHSGGHDPTPTPASYVTPLSQQPTASSTHTTDSNSMIPLGSTMSNTTSTTAAMTAEKSRNPFASTAPVHPPAPVSSNPLDKPSATNSHNDGNNVNNSNNYIKSRTSIESGNNNNNRNLTFPTLPDRQISRESVDFAGVMAAGRHSPDAFAGLSARFV